MAPALTAGTYTVRAEATGFSTLERSNVLVEVGQNIRVDLALSPGAQTQTITVTEEVPAIDTTSSTLGGTVSNQTIESLPLNGRNFLRLLELRPPVLSSAWARRRMRPAATAAVSERTSYWSKASRSLKWPPAAASSTAPGKGGFADSSNTLPLDAIQEFNTQQNAAAEYGWRDGSVVNVGIKSGTNSLHGTGYMFYRDPETTDAKNYFTGVVNNAKVEQFGATAGGPAIKDKLFWFVSYEGLRLRTTSPDTTDVASSISLLPAGVTIASASATVRNSVVANSVVDACNAIKQSLVSGITTTTISPLSAQLAGLNAANCVVSPATSTFQNEFFYNPSTTTKFPFGRASSQPLNNGLAKLDYQLNDRNHFTFFYYDSRSVSVTEGTIQPYWDTRSNSKTQEFAGSWVWIPSSTWVNDLRIGYAGTRGEVLNGDVDRLPSDAYPVGYSLNTGVTNRDFGSFPTITFGSSPVQQLGIGGRSGRRGPQGQYNFKDSVSYLRGNHSFKFGGEMVRVKFLNLSTQNTMGTIAFDSLAHFLAGQVNSGGSSIIVGNPEDNFRSKWFAFFVQDTWRITSRLTITPGVRWEYQGPPHDVNNFLGTFDPTSPSGVVQVGPGLPHEKLFSPERQTFRRV